MLYLLPSPLGNLSDITLRTLEVLQKADVFLCEDTRVTRKLLSLLEQKVNLQKKERKFFSFHSHNQNHFLQEVNPNFFDSIVVFMSDAGMPCVSDPGSALVQYAQNFQIPYEVVPGGSAVVLAYSYSGFGDGGFVFDGFLPHKKADRKTKLLHWREKLTSQNLPLIVFESPSRILDSLEDLRGIDGECEIFAIKEMTKKFERFFRGNVLEVMTKMQYENLQGEWVIVIRFTPISDEKKLGSLEILELEIPPKIKAKILAKITPMSSKDWYQKIAGEES